MDIGENSVLRGRKVGSYTLGKEIGSGGEGRVFEIPGQWLVAKIYRKVVGNIEKKITYMVEHPVENLKDAAGDPYMKLAWPQDILYDDTGAFVGYIMPFIEQGVGIFNIARGCDNPASKTMFPRYTRIHNVVAATNLARAVNHLHEHGYIIGDMNSQNILVGPKCCIIILDNDSFDFVDPQSGNHFKCTAGTQEYLAPELQGRNLREESARFTRESDNFSLAIHIFQLLMNNFHPFTGKNLAVNRDSSVNEQLDNIQKGLCPFVRDFSDLTIPVAAPRLVEMVPPRLVADFAKTFTYDVTNVLSMAQLRVTAWEWVNDLSRFLQQLTPGAERVQCPKDYTHIYTSSLGKCGLCAAQERYNAYVMSRKPITKVTVSQTGGTNQTAANTVQKTVATTANTTHNTTTGSANYKSSKRGMDPGLKIFLWLLAASVAIVLYCVSQNVAGKDYMETAEGFWKDSYMTGDSVRYYAFEEPLKGCTSMDLSVIMTEEGLDDQSWIVYAKVSSGWEEIGNFYLPKDGLVAEMELSLDGSLNIEGICVRPKSGERMFEDPLLMVYDVYLGDKAAKKSAEKVTDSSGNLNGKWEATVFEELGGWETNVFVLDKPIVGAESLTIEFTAEMKGASCENWAVYARTPFGWEKINTVRLPLGNGTTKDTMILDGTLTIEAIKYYPENPEISSASGDFSWDESMTIFDVSQNGKPQTQSSGSSGSSGFAGQSGDFSGYWETHTINDWNVGVWVLNKPIRSCTSINVSLDVDADGSALCKEYRVYAMVGNDKWRQIDTLTMTYDGSGRGYTDKTISLDGSKDIYGIGIVPKTSGGYSYSYFAYWINDAS